MRASYDSRCSHLLLPAAAAALFGLVHLPSSLRPARSAEAQGPTQPRAQVFRQLLGLKSRPINLKPPAAKVNN
eukprot:CAMPEP_0194764638 /NCGR_PEP_ID=MMETSP0323_2-20130528/23564_1 /TAXON_ID=2866 ORGANISM="Crypthecodinium cohnii, Strain Seligo" /NCGR_SAMPLE_ID=MMETSP0323_2 /ASSEMBLY_ACC=CAM_ASM_000346 /LENGTH=72 /DNA_ID=CAMNT_0039692335 /DNA_START=262 /DNA_END=480 /DNA_ORIENTATION=+